MKAGKFICLFALLAASPAGAYDLPSATGTHRVRFEADSAGFNEYTRVVGLEGNVRLEELSPEGKQLKLIRARNLSVDMASRTVVSPSDFVMDDDTGTVYGRSGFYDYGNNSGRITDGRFLIRNFVFRGRSVKFDSEGYNFRKASLTSCDEEPPHYRLRASRIRLYPDRYFLAYNTVFFLGKIPVFYFPVIYKPMGRGTPFVSYFYPGYDERNGLFVKSNYMYRLNPNTRVKAYLDYFARRGVGMGGEIDYNQAEKNITNISAYRIREYGRETDRWGLNGGYWHSFNKFNESDPAQYYSQSFFRLISDPAFNNDFFRTNPFAVSPDKQASLAFTRKTNYTVTRLSAYGRDERSAADPEKFRKAYESAPRLDFNTVPFTVLRLPVLNSFAGYFENAKEADLPYYQKKGRGAWTVSKTVPLSRRLILSPSAFYDQAVFLSTAPSAGDAWIGRYGGSLNLRYDRPWGSMDLRYANTQRLRENRFSVDRSSVDKGQELESVYADLFIMARSSAYFRARTSYDLRSYYTASFARRLSPLITEAYYAPRPSLDLYAQNSYSFASGNQGFVAQASAGDKERYFGLGVANYSTDPEAWVLSNTFGFRPWRTSKWRAEAVLRYRLVPDGFGKFQSFKFFEKAVTLYREFHDFRTRWDFRVRSGGVKEFFFFVNLKMNDPVRYDSLEEKSRQFWHPWRQEGAVRD
ncbi:MAG TPA: hypothetical protein DEQ38_13760 [Elusimicrobia bacterium]|nr:MAG: hypothetical protein A2089_02155 [Elusimicrobia bacterium GWD2_63_28]HCC49163.1 hypothetical protein [Elusimicrobiota bacterium]